MSSIYETSVFLRRKTGKDVSDEILDKIFKHQTRYRIRYGIADWYVDWEDFVQRWCEPHGYSRTYARNMMHGGKGEYQILKGYGIIRYSI